MSSLWEEFWLFQKRKCALCGKFVSLNNTAKNASSFKILCSSCYKYPKRVTQIIMDELADY